MSRDIRAGGAYVELMLKDKRFVAGLASAGRRLKAFATGAAMAGAAAAAAAAGGIAYGIRQYIKMGDELDKMSQRTGISVEALSELRHAADQSGAALSDVEKSQKRLAKTLVDAQRGMLSSREAFDNLGLSYQEVAAMSPEQQFQVVADALASVEDATLRAGLAQNIFGRSGTQLLPMVENLRTLRQEARDMGITMDTEAATGAARLLDMLTILGKQSKAIFFEIGAAAAPFLEMALPAIQSYAATVIEQVRAAGDFVRANVGNMMQSVASAWGYVYDFVAPLAGAYYATIYTSFTGATEIIYAALDGATQAVASAFGIVLDSTGSAMTNFRDLVISGLAAVSFGFNEWAGIVEMSVVSAQLSVVRWSSQVGYYFGTVIPGYLSWFADNWFEIFTDVVTFTGTVASNIGANLKSLWDGIVSLFSGEGFTFEWTPLTSGFESAIKELPQIAAREIGPMEKELQDQLNGLADTMVGKFNEHGEKFEAIAQKFTAPDPFAKAGEFNALKRPDAPSQPEDAEFQGAAGNFQEAKKKVQVGFSAAALAGAGGGGTVRIQRDQLSAIKRLDETMRREGQRNRQAMDQRLT